MRYKVSGKVKKWTAVAVSLALIICTAPSVPALADEAGTIKQVNFGMVNTSAGDTSTVILSISPDFNKPKNIAEGKVEKQYPINATSWILATENSTDSMEAKVKDNKIVLTEGYGNSQDYYGSQDYNIVVEHKKAEDVLDGATDVVSVISTKDKTEILYYGNLDENTLISSESSSFKIPAGLEKGNYNMYILAENTAVNTPKQINTSKLGDPIDIEVVSSLKFDITGLDEPEAGKLPDTQAVLKIGKDGETWEKDINISWKDETGSEVEDEFLYNRNYYAYASLEDAEGYIAGITSAKINGKDAEFNKEQGTISKDYQTKPLDTVNISGAVGSDNRITLKAYKGVIPPSVPDTEYTYVWWNGNLDTSQPAYTGQNHILTQDDFDVTIKTELNTARQDNAASTETDIKGGLLKTSVIEGVTKTNETIKRKADGVVEGLTSEMAYSLDGGNTYVQCTTNKLENLAAGTTCRVKIEKNGLIPSGVTGIYADYVIGDGVPVTVSFDSDGGSGVNAIEGIAYNTAIIEPAQPVKEGYIFEGWYKDTTGNDKWNFSEDKVTENITLIAKWSKKQEINPDNATEVPADTKAPVHTTEVPADTKAPVQTPEMPADTKAPVQTPEMPADTKVPVQTPEMPADTKVPVHTTEVPADTKAPVQPSEVPSDTKTPVQTAAPDNTIKPDGTKAPVTNPSSNNGFISPSIPQTTQQTHTMAPVQTEVPSQTGNPSQTQETIQTQAPDVTGNGPSKNPETQEPQSTGKPENQPSQVPSGENNTGKTDSFTEKGGKTFSNDIEFKNIGDGNAAISGIDTENNKNIIIPGYIIIDGIEYSVTKINDNAFAGSDIESVEFDDNIVEIGKGAFKNCKELKTVKFKNGINIIGKGSFKNCGKLTEIKLPDTIRKIKKNAFKNCKKMKKFNLGTAESAMASENNKKLALRFGTNTAKVSIGASALENCADLRSVVINSQVTKIGNSTFKYCSQLRKMLVKSLKLQKVGNQALKGVNNCKITVPPVKLKPYTTLFKNKGQGKKVVVAKS